MRIRGVRACGWWAVCGLLVIGAGCSLQAIADEPGQTAPVGFQDVSQKVPEVNTARFPIAVPLPPGTLVVPHDAPLQPGTKLGCHIQGRWVAVKVTRLLPTGPVAVDSEKVSLEPGIAVIRNDLIIAKNLLIQLQRQVRDPLASPRQWKATDGRDEILASILNLDEQQITLRKPDGNTMRWPLEQLHPDDLHAVKLHRAALH